MPNPLNFGSTFGSMTAERPYRLTQNDQELVVTGEKTVLFGTHPNDNVELWFYNTDGSFAGNIRLPAASPYLSLSTVVDNTGAYESLNLDFEAILPLVPLSPGRYAATIYFYRDEVGSYFNRVLYIDQISSDRTEVRLTTADHSDSETQNSIFEFVVPSVPRVYAKALIDQMFGKNVDAVEGESITASGVSQTMDSIIDGTVQRIVNAKSASSYKNLFEYIKEHTYQKAVEALKEDSSNYYVQSSEIDSYISDALDSVVQDLISRKMVDPRFILA